MSEYRVVFITVPTKDEANRLASGLVEERLAACVNIVPGIESVYRWQGEIHTDSEWLLIGKTSKGKADDLTAWVIDNHSYDVPEVIQLPIEAGSAPYLNWIDACLAN